MPTNVTVENAQHNFYQYVRQLVDGSLDRLNMIDGVGGSTIASMVTYAAFTAADPSGSAGVESDVVTAYSGHPQVYKGPLYKLIKNMRDRQAAVDAAQATGAINEPPSGAGVILDTETFTLTNAAGTATVFEFDVGGGGITGDVAVATTALVAATGNIAIPAAGGSAIVDGETFTLINSNGVSTVFEFDDDATSTGDVAIAFTGAENQAALSALVFAAINGAGIDITATDNGTDVDLAQDIGGGAGNTTISETVVDAGFVVTSFSGGVGETQAQLSALIFAAINGAGIDITAVDNGTNVAVTQDTAGTAGNVTITETVANAGFTVSGFAGGTDVGVEGGVIALRYSKNDTSPVVVMLPYDHANAIGL